MAIHLAHSEIPSCGDCQRWIYDRHWLRSMRAGKPIPRGRAPTPCRTCPKSDRSKPNPGGDMTGRAWRAYQLFLAVKAGMPMPQDLIAIRNCALIQTIVDRVTAQRGDVSALVSAMFGGR